MEWAQILTLRDGKIIRTDNYDDRSEALKAAGLRDQEVDRKATRMGGVSIDGFVKP